MKKFQLPFRVGGQGDEPNGGGKGTPSPAFLKKMLVLVVNTALLTAIYFICNRNGFWLIFPIYASVLAILALVFVIYNRGFSRKGLTAEMLPTDWSEEQKQEFLRDGENRLARSRWMLYLIVPLLLSFLFDFAYLWILDLGGRGT